MNISVQRYQRYESACQFIAIAHKSINIDIPVSTWSLKYNHVFPIYTKPEQLKSDNDTIFEIPRIS